MSSGQGIPVDCSAFVRALRASAMSSSESEKVSNCCNFRSSMASCDFAAARASAFCASFSSV